MDRVLSSYLALIVSAVLGHFFLLIVAVFLPLNLWPWLVLQLVFVPLAAGVGWRFPGWISIFDKPLADRIREFRATTEQSKDARSDKVSSNSLLLEAELQLRSEIRQLTAIRKE